MTEHETYISIGDLAKKAQISQQTLRRWDAAGKLTPAIRLRNGTRLYTQAQAQKCIDEQRKQLKTKLASMEDKLASMETTE